MTNPTISAVICTYNRAKFLKDAIRSLCIQKNCSFFEILIIDNNSTDETPDIIKSFSSRVSGFREIRQGLSYARNRAIKESRGAYIAFFDDDVIVPTQWLSRANEIIRLVAPGVFGGPNHVCFEETPPVWYRSSYAYIPKLGDEARYLNQKKEFLFGANICFRRNLLIKLGGFDPQLGVKGAAIGCGEETQLQIRICNEMPEEKIYYDPELYVDHFTRKEEMSLGWIARKEFAYGRDNYFICSFPAAISFFHLMVRFVRIGMCLFLDLYIGVLCRDKTLYPHFQNYYIEHSFVQLNRLGQLYRQLCDTFVAR
ncbi:MAG: glycosyltransferase [Candidatus Omnitrophota bacterium]|jgi:glycosyltransferase involved in cell wall biosynthesis